MLTAVADYNKLSSGKTTCCPPITAELDPRADGSTVRTALLYWPRHCAPSWPRPGGTDGTDAPLQWEA